MDNQPAINSTHSSPARFLPWLFVLAVLLFVGFIRVRQLNMPLERDEGEYAYAGQLILQGIPPYELAYNMKLPGTYFAYAMGMAVFGESIRGVHLTLLMANSLTIIFVFLLGQKLFGQVAGLVACASYAVMSVSPIVVVGLAAHATQFVVLFAVPATLFLWRADANKMGATLFFSGLLYGLSFLMVQQGICFCLFGCAFLIWRAALDKTIFSTVFLRRGLPFGLGLILPFALFCFSCLIAGDFARFWFWTFAYAHQYATLLPWSEGWQNLTRHLQLTRSVSPGLCLLALAGLPLAWLNRATRPAALFVAVFWLFSFLGVSLGLYFRGHYFVLVLPAYALLVGMAVSSLQRILAFGRMKNVLQTLPMILFAAAASWVIFYQAQFFFQLPPPRVWQNLYQSNPFVEAVPVAGYIRDHSATDARIAVIGSEPEIYFYARRHSATGYIYTYSLMEPQPAALRMQNEMIREIEANRPEYLVWVGFANSWLTQPSSPQAIFNWFSGYAKEFYERVGIVNTGPAGQTIYLWGDEAKDFQGQLDQNLTLYRRKPASESTPARTH